MKSQGQPGSQLQLLKYVPVIRHSDILISSFAVITCGRTLYTRLGKGLNRRNLKLADCPCSIDDYHAVRLRYHSRSSVERISKGDDHVTY